MMSQAQGFCPQPISVQANLTNQDLDQPVEVLSEQPSELMAGCPLTEQDGTQSEIGKHSPEALAPISVHFNFDYSLFPDQALANKAKTTLYNFLGFVRQTFDKLLTCGQALQEIYQHCIANSNHGKQIFTSWIASPDFGASSYIAKSSITIYNWFVKLPQRVQQLVKAKVQNWSVAALRQLTQVSSDLVQELVNAGKKTAAQIKTRGSKTHQTASDSYTTTIPAPSDRQAKPGELAPGMRIIVVNDDTGWSGSKGIITSKYQYTEKDTAQESWWVLLDHVVAQGQETKHLLRAEQIQPETLAADHKKSHLPATFTAAEVEEKIAAALAQREREQAEAELGRFVEIRDAALQAAAEEIRAVKQNAQKITEENYQLWQQLAEKERQIAAMPDLSRQNQQLQQRVADLENALQRANENSWQDTFAKQAAKVVNSNLEQTIAPLMTEIEQLNTTILGKNEQLKQLKSTVQKQQEELIKVVQSIMQSDGITAAQQEKLATLKGLVENLQSDYPEIQNFLSG